ncbi:hypothetical protein BOW53_04695 [Solemya pervernicosa gill symbiont]|uniref:Glycosyltransferase 2-like domain-containing protein n=2 Tax=Gammaproteobacteria incertae sedis TaxID=118884 RepID=A0A1T2L7X6_9GAMM|nr:glycosyltransferase family A protein [Candidatus Reidiella endopervernicosa]OOZ41170.1 hypothetical protein BOW53_04695 [Solemya pervernicosa gill symbiont]QKQ27109.1 glycosyltransferase family 2 protein [Candidatus Reidiella endopervernicosa]
MSSVSVVIPAYNAATFIAEAIESVLAQSYPATEIIVVDDGSEDETAAVASRFGNDIKLFRQENRGIGAARNLGLDHVCGELVTLLDADDRWHEDKLALQVDCLNQNLGIDMVFGHVVEFLCPHAGSEASQLEVRTDAMPGYYASTLLIRARVIERIGKFSEDVSLGEFIDWYGRAKDAGLKIHLLDHVVAERRVHGSNTSVLQRAQRDDLTHLLKTMLDRRRKSDLKES